MPEPAQRHRQDHGGEILQQAIAAAEPRIGERMKQIVAQEREQRHVPALPEILQTGGAERRVEIVGELDAEQDEGERRQHEHREVPDRHQQSEQSAVEPPAPFPPRVNAG